MYQLLRGVSTKISCDCHSRIECLDSKSVIKNLLGFRACNFQHVSLASGRTVFSSCGADPSKAKKRLSAPNKRPFACIWPPNGQTTKNRAKPSPPSRSPLNLSPEKKFPRPNGFSRRTRLSHEILPTSGQNPSHQPSAKHASVS